MQSVNKSDRSRMTSVKACGPRTGERNPRSITGLAANAAVPACQRLPFLPREYRPCQAYLAAPGFAMEHNSLACCPPLSLPLPSGRFLPVSCLPWPRLRQAYLGRAPCSQLQIAQLTSWLQAQRLAGGCKDEIAYAIDDQFCSSWQNCSGLLVSFMSEFRVKISPLM